MSRYNRWVKVVDDAPAHRDISYEYLSPDGAKLGIVYRGGNRWYPWSWSVTGGRSGAMDTMRAAKDRVTIEVAKKATP